MKTIDTTTNYRRVFMQKFVLLTQGRYLDDGRFVKRIRALHDFGNVKEGTIGGFVECSDNLSQKGNCWIADNAVAAGWSRVTGDAKLRDYVMLDQHASASEQAMLSDSVLCNGYAAVYGNSIIGASSYLTGGATVRGFATVFCESRYFRVKSKRLPNLRDNVTVCGYANLTGEITLYDTATVAEKAILQGYIRMRGNSYAGGSCLIQDRVSLADNAKVIRNARVMGQSRLSGNAIAGGYSVISGKSRLICNVYVGGRVHIVDRLLSGDEIHV